MAKMSKKAANKPVQVEAPAETVSNTPEAVTEEKLEDQLESPLEDDNPLGAITVPDEPEIVEESAGSSIIIGLNPINMTREVPQQEIESTILRYAGTEGRSISEYICAVFPDMVENKRFNKTLKRAFDKLVREKKIQATGYQNLCTPYHEGGGVMKYKNIKWVMVYTITHNK